MAFSMKTKKRLGRAFLTLAVTMIAPGFLARANQMSLAINGLPFINSEDADDARNRKAFSENPRYELLSCRVDGIGTVFVPCYRATTKTKGKVIIIWPGSADAPETVCPTAFVNQLPENCGVIFMRYPDGNPTPEDINRCAKAVFASYEQIYGPVTDIREIGNSLGCAPALQFADDDRRVKKIAAINPFDTLQNQTKHEYGPLGLYLSLFFDPSKSWDNVALSKKLFPNQELDIISSKNDKRVSETAKRRIAIGNGQFIPITGGHDGALGENVADTENALAKIDFFPH